VPFTSLFQVPEAADMIREADEGIGSQDGDSEDEVTSLADIIQMQWVTIGWMCRMATCK
jgi:hypothetical protein